VKEIVKTLRMRYIANMSLREIASALKLPHTTVANYCKRFEQSKSNLESLLNLGDEDVYKALFSKLPNVDVSASSTKFDNNQDQDIKIVVKSSFDIKPIPNVEYIHKEIAKKGVTFELLWQEYKEINPNGYAITQFKEYYYRYKKKLNPSMRQTHIAGDKLFIDYSGLTMNMVDQITGETSKVQIFVAVLGASGYTFAHATHSQKVKDFILSHTLAFNFFGGVPNMLVPDNLKSAIISNNKKGVVENESYSELARHYGCVINPARPRKPKDKSKVEQGVQGIQRWIIAVLRNRVFFSVDEINEVLSSLLDRYNNKVMRHIGKSRSELFVELDKQALQPLPQQAFVYKEFKLAMVHLDYHVELNKCYYSVPYKYLKEKVEIRYSHQTIEIYHKNILIATHIKLTRINECSTKKEHMPLNHQYANEKMNPTRLLNWAISIGEATHKFISLKLEVANHPVNAYRSIIAILNLAKTYGKSELDKALSYAMSINTYTYKSVESIVSKKLYLLSVATQPSNNTATTMNTHNNLRGKEYYQ